MNKIKKIANTIAILLANLLRFKPTGWQASADQARMMAADAAKDAAQEAVEVVLDDGQTVNPTPSISPLAYLFHAAMACIMRVFWLWLSYVALKACISIMVVLIPVALLVFVVLKVWTWLKQPDPSESVAAASAT
jgi:hypothetical protein